MTKGTDSLSSLFVWPLGESCGGEQVFCSEVTWWDGGADVRGGQRGVEAVDRVMEMLSEKHMALGGRAGQLVQFIPAERKRERLEE